MIRALLLVIVLSGCALTSKSKPLEVRYFSPEVARKTAEAPATPSGLELKLGRISGASHIKDELVYRDAGQALGFHAGRRWAEAPQDYVRRALTRDLFQSRGLKQIVAGPGLVLDADLETFEERRAPARVARVDLTWRLRDDKVVLVQRTVTVEHPIAAGTAPGGEPTPDAVASAMANTLGEALDQTVEAVVTELGKVPATPAPR
jgi:ABC-type uncharacterized transport system auxiliary subunit